MTQLVSVSNTKGTFLNFDSIGIDRAFNRLVGVTQIVCAIRKESDVQPVQVGDLLTVYINGIPYQRGYVEKTIARCDKGITSIDISICDLTRSITKTHILPENSNFQSPISLETLCRSVLSSAQIPIKVYNNVPDLTDINQSELANADIGETCFSFLSKHATLKGVFLVSYTGADLTITRAGQQESDTPLLNNRPGFQGNVPNNIIKSEHRKSTENRWATYRCLSQKSTSDANYWRDRDDADFSQLINNVGEALDIEIASLEHLKHQINIFEAEKTTNDVTVIDRAIWRSNYNTSTSTEYVCTIPSLFEDLSIDGTKPWYPGLKVQITDTFLNVSGKWIIKDVRMYYDKAQGTVTDLILVPPGSFELQPGLGISNVKSSQRGTGF